MNQNFYELINKGWIIILITVIIIYHWSDIGYLGKTRTKYRPYNVNPPHLWQKIGGIKKGGGDLSERQPSKNVPKNDQNTLYLSFSKNMTKSEYEREGGHRAPQASLSQIRLKKGDLKVVGGVRHNIILTV